MNIGSTTEYRRAPGETTEWEDALVKHGIIEKPPSVHSESEDEVEEGDPLESKGLDELDELDDDDEFADDRILAAYREKRLAEMKARAKAAKFGRVLPLVRADYLKEVNEASNECFVVLHLHQDYIRKSVRLAQVFAELAAKHRATKFMIINATQCIDNYPDFSVPTTLIYHKNESLAKLVGVDAFGGAGFTTSSVEWTLSKYGAVETDLEEMPDTSRTNVTRLTGRRGDDADDDDDE